jgi:N-ethylmaleimide reductase
MTQERGNRLMETGLADSIAFGRLYIANPDLPEPFLMGSTQRSQLANGLRIWAGRVHELASAED